MNEAEPLDWMWFKNDKGIIGIVKVRSSEGKIEYRISSVDGFMERMDVLQVVAWGAHFPTEAGKALMK